MMFELKLINGNYYSLDENDYKKLLQAVHTGSLVLLKDGSLINPVSISSVSPIPPPLPPGPPALKHIFEGYVDPKRRAFIVTKDEMKELK